MLCLNSAHSQTILNQGDVAIVGFNASSTDQFSVVLLRDIAANTVIQFTDNGMASPTAGRSGENFLNYTSVSGDCAGTVLTWTNGMNIAGTGWSSGAPSNFAFNASGDQLIVFQGQTTDWVSQNAISIIFALNTNGNWLTTGVAAATSSYFPASLSLSNSMLTTFPNLCFSNSTLTDIRSNILLTLTDISFFNTSATALTFPTYTDFTVIDDLISITGSDNQNVCLSQGIDEISYQIAGESATALGLPPGVSGNYTNGVFTINGTPTISGTFNFSVTSIGCQSSALNGIIVVNDLSAPIAASPQSFCSSISTIADLNAAGSNIQWFDLPSGGTVLPSNAVLTSGNYYAQSVSGSCESTLTLVEVSIGGSVSPPVAASPQSFCSSISTIADLNAAGSNIQWYDLPSGGTVLPSNTVLTSGNYYAQSISGSCESTLTLVEVSIGSSVSPPVASSPQSFCSSISTIADLNAAGSNIQWFDLPSGGSVLPSNAVLTSGNYYASETINGCESVTRTLVEISLISVSPPVTSTQSFCASSQAAIQDLVASGSAVQWYNASVGGAPLLSSQLLVSGIYYASSSLGSCESSRTATNVVVENPIQPAVLAGNPFLCLGQNGQLNSTSTAGAWSSSASIISIDAISGLITTNGTGIATINYTIDGNGVCAAAITNFDITILDIPTVNLGNDTSICEGSFPYTLMAQTSQANLNYTWNGAQTTQSIDVTTEGNYSVVVEDNYGCLNTDAIQISLQAAPELTILGAAIDEYIYNGQSYTQTGTYTQIIPNTTGCDSVVTLILTFNYLGLEESNTNLLHFYPNPVHEVLFVESALISNGMLQILNIEGKILKQIALEQVKFTIDLSDLQSGVYFITLKSGNTEEVHKFFKD